MTRVSCDRCRALVPGSNLTQHYAGHKCRVGALRLRAIAERWTAPTRTSARNSVQRLVHNRRTRDHLDALMVYDTRGRLLMPSWVSAVADAVAHLRDVVAVVPGLTALDAQTERDRTLRELLQVLHEGGESEWLRLPVLALGGPMATLAYLQETGRLSEHPHAR